jgi:shikimate 5-dehydrogenase
MKWVVMGAQESDPRFVCLSDELKNLNIPNELTFANPNEGDILLEAERQTKKVDQIRMLGYYSEVISEYQNRSTGLTSLLGAADALVKRPTGEWWPCNYLYEGFSLEFVKHVKMIDLSSSALIVGSGAASKTIVGALVKFGFSRFNITDRFEDRAKSTIEKLKKSFFGVEFTFIPQATLMTLPGGSSVLLNSTPLRPDNDLLLDLYYFNFLKNPGIIIDLNLVPPQTPLIEEGKSVGANIICGYEISARTDVLWAKDAIGADIDLEGYKERLKKKMEEVPFDPTPYQHA